MNAITASYLCPYTETCIYNKCVLSKERGVSFSMYRENCLVYHKRDACVIHTNLCRFGCTMSALVQKHSYRFHVKEMQLSLGYAIAQKTI